MSTVNQPKRFGLLRYFALSGKSGTISQGALPLTISLHSLALFVILLAVLTF
jgi:hypothetical protein